MSSELLDQIKEQASALSVPEKAQLAAFLAEQLQQTERTSAFNVPDDDIEMRARRMAWLKEHREEYAGQYVALDGDVLVGVGRTIREAHSQAKEKNIKNPFLVRVTSEHEILSAGW